MERKTISLCTALGDRERIHRGKRLWEALEKGAPGP